MMWFKIYQLVKETEYAYMNYTYAFNHGFNFNDYKEVYSGEREKKCILDNLWEEFNINHPADFRGHSMSVSDIIALKDEDKDYWYWYYCDSFGWKEITEVVNKQILNGDKIMQAGDIVTFWDKSVYNHYMGVVMEINNDLITIQDMGHEQYDIPAYKVSLANDDDMLEELRCLYGFYH